jgi:predicted transcriptional regulator
MSYNTTIANPVSFANLSQETPVSDLESALMQNIGQDVQSGHSLNSANVQQEINLLTDLLSPMNTNENDPSQKGQRRRNESNDGPGNSNLDEAYSNLQSALEQDISKRLQSGQDQTNNNSVGQEINLLIEVLSRTA